MLITWSVFSLVTIEDPCTDDHKYTLGRDGLIVIKAVGNKFFTGSCVVTLRAEDPRYQCSKLCFTVDSFKFSGLQSKACLLRYRCMELWVSSCILGKREIIYLDSDTVSQLFIFSEISCVVRFISCIIDSGKDFMIYNLNPNWNFRRWIGSLFIFFSKLNFYLCMQSHSIENI